ncbi:hypothetical protein BsWGS_08819 [Bradybaena similaris]
MLKMGKTHFVLLVAVLLVDVTQSVSTWKKIFGGYYLIGKPFVTWTEAKQECVWYRGMLLEIENTTEYENIVRQFITDDITEIWIGGNYRYGEWRWDSNYKVIDPDLGGNYSDDYDAGDEFCLELRRSNNFILSDSDCNERKQFVCEKSR